MTQAPQWVVGQVPTATLMNQYGTALNEAHVLLGDSAVNGAAYDPKTSGTVFYLRHTHRFLLYHSTGQIVDFAKVGDSVALSSPNGATQGVYDLETVSWLTYGMLYSVTGVSTCMEYWTA